MLPLLLELLAGPFVAERSPQWPLCRVLSLHEAMSTEEIHQRLQSNRLVRVILSRRDELWNLVGDEDLLLINDLLHADFLLQVGNLRGHEFEGKIPPPLQDPRLPPRSQVVGGREEVAAFPDALFSEQLSRNSFEPLAPVRALVATKQCQPRSILRVTSLGRAARSKVLRRWSAACSEDSSPGEPP